MGHERSPRVHILQKSTSVDKMAQKDVRFTSSTIKSHQEFRFLNYEISNMQISVTVYSVNGNKIIWLTKQGVQL